MWASYPEYLILVVVGLECYVWQGGPSSRGWCSLPLFRKSGSTSSHWEGGGSFCGSKHALTLTTHTTSIHGAGTNASAKPLDYDFHSDMVN